MTDDGSDVRRRYARGHVSEAEEQREREQEAEYEKLVNARAKVHRDTNEHRRWAKKHFCPKCYEAWVRAGKPGELAKRDGELHKTWRDILDD